MKQNSGRFSFSPIQIFESPINAGITSFLIYALFATQAGPIWQTTHLAYFNYLADAFLHGQLHLRLVPALVHDLAFYNGNYYLYWPPFPAVLLMPFVALFGVRFSDVFFTLSLAAVNVGLVAYFLRLLSIKGIVSTQPWHRFLLTIFFAFGTVHLILARWGLVWFTSQIIAFLCGLLAYIIVIRYQGAGAFFFSGLLLSFATLTRNHLIFLGIWPAYYLFEQHNSVGKKKLIGYFFLFALPIVIALLVYLAYNWQRFGNVFEIGISYQDLGPFFQADFETYGTFSLRYIPTNFYYNFLYYPFPLSEETLMGGSLFLLSPVFVSMFWGFTRDRHKASNQALGITILATLIPIMINIGTGWSTFGPRYTLDLAPPLLILTAAGILRFPRRIFIILTAVSVTHYIIGALLIWFY
jgi:hypothetical protein